MDIGELFENETSRFGDEEYQDTDEHNVQADEAAAAAAAASSSTNSNSSSAAAGQPAAKVQPRIISRAQRLAMKKQQVEQAIINAVANQLEAEEEKLDDQLAKLDNLTTDELDEIRAKRVEQMKRKAQQKEQWLANAHGTMNELHDQKQFFEHVKTSKHVICLFYSKTNKYCDTLNEHLTVLAGKHLECKFLKIHVESAPFLMTRLNIWMIPTLVCATNNKVDRKLCGLDWCAPDGKIDTIVLEKRLFEYGFFEETYMQIDQHFKKYKKAKANQQTSSASKYASDDSDDDLDI